MSASLDLDGGNITLLADTIYEYFQVKDTSANKDGTLTMEPGAELYFDDLAGSGFATDWVGELHVQGNSSALCKIASVDDIPHHPWAMALAVDGDITRCRIAGNQSYSSSGTVALANVVFGYDVYCTVSDVRRIVGIAADQVGDADLSAFIEMACDEIDDFSGRKWYTGTVSNEDIDYWGAGFVKVEHAPIQSITSLSYRSASAWEVQTSGPEAAYYAGPLDLKRGIVRVLEEPAEDLQAVRVSYTFGEDSPAGRIRKLATALAARDALLAVSLPEKASVIDSRVDRLDSLIMGLKSQLGRSIRGWTGQGTADDYRYPGRKVSSITRGGWP